LGTARHVNWLTLIARQIGDGFIQMSYLQNSATERDFAAL
jgi:hypothetical protein